MQAVVKTPHIEIKIKGTIPGSLLALLKKEYGKKLRFTEKEDNERVNVFETDWYKKIKKETSFVNMSGDPKEDYFSDGLTDGKKCNMKVVVSL